MKTDTKNREQDHYLSVKKMLRRRRLFYLHLVGYFIFVGLIILNFAIIEDNQYKNNIISLNLSILIAWTIFIALHGFDVFKGEKIFDEKWKAKKTDDFLNENKKTESTIWE